MTVSRQAGAEPHIKWNHVDGPMLTCRDGSAHWLTMWERFLFRAGFLTLEELDKRYNSEPQKGW